jgi:hypothetical protein
MSAYNVRHEQAKGGCAQGSGTTAMMDIVSYQVYPDQGGYMLYACSLKSGMRPRHLYRGEHAEQEANEERDRLNKIEVEYQKSWTPHL